MSSSSSDTSLPLSSIAQNLLHGAFQNIMHDLLTLRHREHKLMLASLDPTTKLPHCERCNLPRLLDPPLAPSVRGATTDPPNDTAYCEKRPWSRRPGFDIYGNPFPKADLTGRPPTKKEREQAKKDGKNADGTPASNEGGTAPPSPTAQEDAASKNNSTEKLEKGEKKASKIDEKLKKGEYVPWQTCPNCKRSLLIIRFAKHLEQCMGLSGRAASRNAMAKMNGNGSGVSNTPGGGTPAGSRGGTPAPENAGGSSNNNNNSKAEKDNAGEDDDEDDVSVKIKGPGEVRKKLLKKGLNSKLSKSSLSNSKQASASNNKSSTSATESHSQSSKRDFSSMLSASASGEADDEDADNDEENVHVSPKKRQKLQRVESGTSFGSAGVDVESQSQLDDINDGSSFLGEEESQGDD